MSDIKASALTGAVVMLEESAVEAFRSGLRGQLLRPADEGYDAARTVWNAMIDKRPALIARCAGAADVICAVNFARTHGLLLSVRGGGHNVGGNAVCNDGLMIDLSPMRGIRVDPVNRTARAEPGLTWKELDHETLAFGLATTGGTVSHTGIAGLTLGGGVGWQMARHGLTCDNLISVDIVTADGKLLVASATQHEDLFWAVRGGGGNFGVVTSFEYRLHPMEPMMLGGMVLYPMAQAEAALKFYRDYSRHAPDDLTAFAALLTLPDGVNVCAIIVGWFGPPEEGARRLEPLRNFGAPLADLTGPMPYSRLQALFDDAAPFGIRRYWKSGYFPELPDELIEVILKHAGAKTSPYSAILFFHIHGAAARVQPDATAFGARQNQWDFDILPQWLDDGEDGRHLAWARGFWREVEPFTKGVYTNHLDADDGATRVRAAYGQNYEQLVSVKTKYDPENLFRLNSNILPTT
ncbi:MAG: FAD-binding oxidoreductase [Blastocatellales bacterium]